MRALNLQRCGFSRFYKFHIFINDCDAIVIFCLYNKNVLDVVDHAFLEPFLWAFQVWAADGKAVVVVC